MALYLIGNGPSPTTAPQASVATGTAIKTMLQVKASATKPLIVVQVKISFNGSAAGTPIKYELVETDVAATVTASAAADIVKLDGEALAGGDPTTNLIPVGTTSTGYTASVEGSITSVRMLDFDFIAPTDRYCLQFPLGREPVVQISKFLRIRVTAPADVGCYCSLIVQV